MTTSPSPRQATNAEPATAGRRGVRDARIARREQARQDLIEAAYTELERRPWPQITIDDLTRIASLSRTAFYQHFTDRQHLLLELLDARVDQFSQVGGPWTTGGTDPVTELETTLSGIVTLFVEHGRLLQAVRDSAVTDPAIADAWTALVEHLIRITAGAIARDHHNGHTTIIDAEQIARALTRMDEAYLLDSFGRHPLADATAATTALTRIWLNALFAKPPASSPLL